jgi:outer membrane receptor protein involved in Fe transport
MSFDQTLLRRYCVRRTVFTVFLVVVAAVGSAFGAPRGAAAQQEVVSSETLGRGPQFFYAPPGSGAVVRVDASVVVVLRRRVSLDVDSMQLGTVLEKIGQQAGIHLNYSRSLVRLDTPVSIHARDLTVAAALTEVLFNDGVDVVVLPSGQVSLRKRGRRQVGTIVGRVTDAKTREPIMAATVELDGTRFGAVSNDSGGYRISNVPAGAYTLTARRLGYTKTSQSVMVADTGTIAVDVALAPAATALDQVVVTGTLVPTEVKALPTPVSVLSDSLIAQQHPHTVQELFRQAVPTAVSWDMPAYPVQTTFSVRGASALSGGSGQMKVFVDGIEAANFTFAAVDPASIARIEVIRGPEAAAIYGSDAIGGVIQIFTKRGDPTITRPQVSATASVGVIQTPYAGYGGVMRQTSDAAVRGTGPDVSYNFGAGYTHTADYAGPVSAQSSPSVYGGVHLNRGIVTADVTGRYYVQNNPQIANPHMLQSGYPYYAKPLYEPGRYQNQTLGARLSVAATPWWQHTVTVGLDGYASDLTQSQPRRTTPADTLLTIFQTSYSKASIGYTTVITGALGAGLSGSLTAGVDHYSLPVSSVYTSGALTTTGAITTAPGRSPVLSQTVTTNTGYFAQAQLGVREALFLTAGLRAEQNSNFGDSLGTPISPRLGLSYVHALGGTTLKLRGSWGRAIKAPPPGDKEAVVSASSVLLANPVLGPERQRGWDAGVDLLVGARGSLGVTYYDQTAENLIQLVQVPSDSVRTSQYQNVGRVQNHGVELEGTLTLGVLALRAQYGYARARIAQLAPGYTGDLKVGDQSLLTPRQTAGASLALTALKGTTLTGGLTYVGSWTEYDFLGYYRCLGGTGSCRNPAPHPIDRSWVIAYPGFVKLNATLTQQVTRQLSGFLSVDNLTNNQAYEFYNFNPVMGRITTVGLRVQY